MRAVLCKVVLHVTLVCKPTVWLYLQAFKFFHINHNYMLSTNCIQMLRDPYSIISSLRFYGQIGGGVS